MTHWTERLYREQAGTFAQLLENRVSDAPEEVEAVLDLLEAERGLDPDRVLNVACGIGRHALMFAERGIETDGLDLSAEFVERARSRAAERDLADSTRFHVADMRNLDDWDGTYDLVTMFWHSLGYYDRATDVEVLANLRDLLAPGGALVLEMNNRDHCVHDFEAASVHEDEDRLHVSRREFDLETGRVHSTVDVFDVGEDGGYDHCETMEFRPRLYAPVELVELCEEAGFERVDLFGGFDGSDLSLDGPRVIVLAGH